MDDLQHTFEAAFEAYSDELFRHASIRLSDRERAMELTQETFMKVWAYAQKDGQAIRDLRPFLYRTLRNLIIDEYRKHKATSLEAMAERNQAQVEDYLPPDESNTLEAAVGRYDGAKALVALQELPEPYREAVVMRYVEGLSPQEIAKAIDESENVVSVRVHRGLKKLKEILEAQEPTGQH